MLRSKWRERWIVVAKLAFAALLIAWLIYDGKVDFGGLQLYWRQPAALVVSLCFWMFGAVFFCALRWRALVHGIGVALSLAEAMRLNLMGLFFNTFMPGAVGGDLIKAMYLCKGSPVKNKASIFLTIVLDRLCGLVALFILSLLGMLLNGSVIAASDALLPIALLILLFLGALATFAFVLYVPSVYERLAALRLVKSLLVRVKPLAYMVDALLAYRAKPRALAQAMAYGLLHQTLFVIVFLTVTYALTDGDVPIGPLMAILPIGIVTTAIPVAPSGLGVGHVAFERLFVMIGLSGGANVFNVIIVGQMALNMLGVLAYLMSRAEVRELLGTTEQQREAVGGCSAGRSS